MHASRVALVRRAKPIAAAAPPAPPLGERAVIGFVACEARGALRKLAVWPEGARRHGVGRTLLRSALATMKRDGVLAARLHVEATNQRALGLYGSVGFEQDGPLIRDYYGSDRHAWRLLRDCDSLKKT